MAEIAFALEHDYPAALGALWLALGRREYVDGKYHALDGVPPRILRLHADAATIDVELERTRAVVPSALPAWARRFATRAQVLHQRSRWRRLGPRRADVQLDVEPSRLPLRARCRGEAVEQGPGCTRLAWHVRVRCDVPLVGAAAARLFARELRGALDADHAFTLDHLAALQRHDGTRAAGAAARQS